MDKKEFNTMELARSDFKKKLLNLKKSLQSFKEIFDKKSKQQKEFWKN